MLIQNLLHASESYAYSDWVCKNVSVGFSRLYYILDGEAFKKHFGLSPEKYLCTLRPDNSPKKHT